MKVLLTGGSGFIGRHVLRALQQHAIPTVLAGRQKPAGIGDAQFIACDLLDASSHQALVQAAAATHLLHLAWVTDPDVYWSSPVNLSWVHASVQLVQSFCATAGKHVVVAGSCAEYDWTHSPCHETQTPLLAQTLYGVAKDATRRLIEAVCAQHGVRCAWARIFFPFGPGEDARRLVPSVIRALQGQSAPFGVNAQTARDFLHVADVASGLLALVQAPATGSYNLCSGAPVRIGDLVCELARLLQRDPSPVLAQASSRPPGPPLLSGDNTRLRSLGWRVENTMSDALALTIRAGMATNHHNFVATHVG